MDEIGCRNTSWLEGGERRMGEGSKCFHIVDSCSLLSRLQLCEGFPLSAGLQDRDEMLSYSFIRIYILLVLLIGMLALLLSATLSADRMAVAKAPLESLLALTTDNL